MKDNAVAILAFNPVTPSTALRARIAILFYFFLAGGIFGNWVSRIPAVQRDLALTEGQLGLALLGLSIGALIAMPLAGSVISHHGSRTVSGMAAVACAIAVVGPALAQDIWTLALALGLYGLATGTLDVSMNVAAVNVEAAYRRTLMPSFHALFSLGGLAGAATGGIVAETGLTPLTHFGLVGMAFGVVTLAVVGWPLHDPKETGATRSRSGMARPDRRLLVLGVIAFCALLGEGAMGDWSAVYLTSEFAASEGLAAAGFAAFSLAMAAGRFSGNSFTDRFGPVLMVRGGGVLAALGLGLALATGDTYLAIIGFALVGIGYASTFPILVSAAAGASTRPAGTAIATLSAIGYVGFLAGPPIIGLIADVTGLRTGLGLVLLLNLAIVVFAGATRYAGNPSPDAEPDSEEFI